MNITVTGATGFVGAQLTRALLHAGHAVHALARQRPADLPAAVEFSQWRSTEPRAAARKPRPVPMP